MASDVQLVCFDLGGVLMRLCSGWGHACKIAGVAAPTRKLEGNLRTQLSEIIARSDLGQLDLPAFSEAAGPLLGVPPAEVIAVSNAYLLGAYPGAADLLHELADRNIASACLSNTNDSHWQMMNDATHAAALPLEKLTHRFASHLIGARKPDPAIYRYVEEITGIPGDHIAFFDDLPANIDAARAVGWDATQIDPAGDTVGQIRTRLAEIGVL